MTRVVCPLNVYRWAALLISVFICAGGAIQYRIFEQPIWYPEGWRRLLIYTTLFAASASLLFFFRRALLVPCFVAAAVLYTAALTGGKTVSALVYYIVASYGLGFWALRAVSVAHCVEYLPAAIPCLVIVTGAAVWTFIVSLLAFSKWNSAAVYILLLAEPALAGLRPFFLSSRRSLRCCSDSARSMSTYWAIALLLYVIGAQFLMSLKPEVSPDGIAVHLAVPQHMAFHHSWHFDVTRISWAVMPMAGDWLFTTVYLLGGEYAAKLLPFVFLVVTAALLAHLCRQQTPQNMALAIAAGYVATPVVQLTTGGMFVDNMWTAFLVSSITAIIASTRRKEPGFLVLAGGLLGTALATKLGALIFLAPCLVWIAAVCLARRTAVTFGAAAGFLAITAAPPYVTAWFKTGNPVFPFFNAIFHSSYFDAASNFRDARFHAPLTWRTPLELTFRTSRFLESQDGALGLTCLFVLLILLSARRPAFSREVLWALLVSVIFFAGTFTAASYVRYLEPALPLLLYGFAGYLRTIRTVQPFLYSAIGCVAVAASLAGVYLLASSGYSHKEFCLSPLRFRAEANEYVAQSAPSRVLVDHLNRTAPHEPVAFITSGIAGIEARAYSAGWHNFTFWEECLRADSAAKLRELMVRVGVRHFVTARPSCGDLTPPLFKDFLAQNTHERFRAGCLYIADLD